MTIHDLQQLADHSIMLLAKTDTQGLINLEEAIEGLIDLENSSMLLRSAAKNIELGCFEGSNHASIELKKAKLLREKARGRCLEILFDEIAGRIHTLHAPRLMHRHIRLLINCSLSQEEKVKLHTLRRALYPLV